MSLTLTRYKKIIPELKKTLDQENVMALPKIEKVVINTGTGRILKDEKLVEEVEKVLALIAGQHPIKTTAKKSIASFKTRLGLPIGFKVTLRGSRMYDFLDRLINTALPRSRDFRGIDQKSIDQAGNLNIGIREHIIFPEVQEFSRHIFGLEVTVVTNAKKREDALKLFYNLGFPIKK